MFVVCVFVEPFAERFTAAPRIYTTHSTTAFIVITTRIDNLMETRNEVVYGRMEKTKKTGQINVLKTSRFRPRDTRLRT